MRFTNGYRVDCRGVDIRAVAGRLGHGRGGATTLRVYVTWRSESDCCLPGRLRLGGTSQAEHGLA
ncbi:MAG: hypothetical protein DLM59_14450 [Pseudonocardiales bacterium]|nr:MAG: hypothetical protein DLM59_14450 [Pseudonocardiales bacterium]